MMWQMFIYRVFSWYSWCSRQTVCYSKTVVDKWINCYAKIKMCSSSLSLFTIILKCNYSRNKFGQFEIIGLPTVQSADPVLGLYIHNASFFSVTWSARIWAGSDVTVSILFAQWQSVVTLDWQWKKRHMFHLIPLSHRKIEARNSVSKLSVLDTFRYENTTKVYRHPLQKSLSLYLSEIVDGKVQNMYDITPWTAPRLAMHRAHAITTCCCFTLVKTM